MMMVLFHDIVRNSLADFVNGLRLHYQFLPSRADQEGTDTTAVLAEGRPKTEPQASILHICILMLQSKGTYITIMRRICQ
jgi:hypothetical protein